VALRECHRPYKLGDCTPNSSTELIPLLPKVHQLAPNSRKRPNLLSITHKWGMEGRFGRLRYFNGLQKSNLDKVPPRSASRSNRANRRYGSISRASDEKENQIRARRLVVWIPASRTKWEALTQPRCERNQGSRAAPPSLILYSMYLCPLGVDVLQEIMEIWLA
jgi:hypothetical protein